MNHMILLRANLKKRKGNALGIFLLLLIVSVTLSAALTVWNNSGAYLRREMARLGYGDLTAWVSGVPDADALAEEIAELAEVEHVGAQEIIFGTYTIHGVEADSEGQMITYRPEETAYRFFTDDRSGYRPAPGAVTPGEIYLSPSLCALFDAEAGDQVSFAVARSGVEKTFTVAGFFEDPFMGSSMIGMKGFLISEQDHDEIAQTSAQAGIDALARPGLMLHIFQDGHRSDSLSELNTVLNERTSLSRYVEFVHTAPAILGFMLVLQNLFTGFLFAFVLVLLAVSLVVLGHSIGSAIEQDYTDMGILKTVGFTSGMLRRLQLLQYSLPILGGILGGLLLSIWVSRLASLEMVSTLGVLVPAELPVTLCIGAFALILTVLICLIYGKTARIGRIAPLQAIQGSRGSRPGKVGGSIHQRGLSFWMAIRQLSSGRKQYVSACLISVLLVFFASLVGLMNGWLGPNGEGLMDAFNPADVDLGVQATGSTSAEDVEAYLSSHTAIVDQYRLAMPSVTVNGVDYTANVIDQPERLHILRGRTSSGPDEVVLTEAVATNLNIDVGGTVTVAAGTGSGTYTVSGIYQCANDMGDNIGMNREGYAAIGVDEPGIWCHHYFLSDPSQAESLMEGLQNAYGGDIHAHQNSWSGLEGIVAAMQGLTALMYAVVAAFVLITVLLTGSKILTLEQKDMGIYRAIGFSTARLRFTFAVRFGVVALVGAIGGTILSTLLTDPLVGLLLRLFGISDFQSHPGVIGTVLPAVVVVVLFTSFAYLSSGRIRKVDLAVLIAE